MDHFVIKRPGLPTSTPISVIGQTGKSNAYSAVIKPHFESLKTAITPEYTEENKAAMQERSKETLQKDFKDRHIQKLLHSLPYSVRENVTAIINMTISSSEIVQKNLELSHVEIIKLRSELKKKSSDAEQSSKSCEIYRDRVRMLEDSLQNLKDNIEARQKYFARNKRATDRLAATNRMLIDALDALQVSQESFTTAKSITSAPARPSQLFNDEKGRSNLLRPISSSDEKRPGSSSSSLSAIAENHAAEKIRGVVVPEKANVGGVQNDKLRESLLRVAREHYRSMKTTEVLETQVDELQAKLKGNERLLRQTMLELDSYRAAEYGSQGSGVPGEGGLPLVNGGDKKQKGSGRPKDDRFKILLNSQAIDPVDGVMIMRNMSVHIAESPTTLLVGDISSHLVSRDACRLFSVEVICLFLVDSHDSDVVHRYSQRSAAPDIINIKESPCLVASVLKSGSNLRSNNASQFQSLNLSVDTIPGVIPRKLIYIPMTDKSTGSIIGVISFINRSSASSGDSFAEIDEMFSRYYSNAAVFLLSTCSVFSRIRQKATTLSSLLESSTLLYDAIPDSNTLAVAKNLQPFEILSMLELIAKNVLHCSKVKGFLSSNFVKQYEADRLLFLGSPSSSVGSTSINSSAFTSGIAGYVAKTKSIHVIENNELDVDIILNPVIDMEPVNGYMITFPIINHLTGTVMACIQFSPGPSSPPLTTTKEHKSEVISFPQSALWLIHQLAPPLEYLLQFVGRPASRPSSTPQNMVKRSSFSFDATRPTFSFESTSSLRISRENSMGDMKNNITISENEEEDEGDTEEGSVDVTVVSSPEKLGIKIPSLNKELNAANSIIEELKLKLQTAEQKIVFTDKDLDKFDELTKSQRLENESLKEEVQKLQQQLKQSIVDKKAASSTQSAEIKIEQIRVEYETKLNSLQSQHNQQLEELKVVLIEASRKDFEGKLNEQLKLSKETTKELNLLKESLSGVEKSRIQAEEKNSTLVAEIDSLRANYSRLKYENDQYSSKQVELQGTLSKQESVISIMQDQLVKFAGESLKEIDLAIKKSSGGGVDTTISINGNKKNLIAANGPKSPKPGTSPRTGPPQTPPPVNRTNSGKTNRSLSPQANINNANSQQESGSDWVEQADDYGQVYFYNTRTHETAWKRPVTAVDIDADNYEAVRHGEWLQQFDGDGNEYWINEVTGESAWELPTQGAADVNIYASQQSIYSTSASAGGYTIDL